MSTIEQINASIAERVERGAVLAATIVGAAEHCRHKPAFRDGAPAQVMTDALSP